MHEIDTIGKTIWALLGATGGFVKVLVQLLAMEKLPSAAKIAWLVFANSFVSGFSGFLGALFAYQFTANDDYHVIAAGVAGYMGVAALDMISERFRNWFEKTPKKWYGAR